MFKMFRIANSTLSAPDRGNYMVPTFTVWAENADCAIDLASKIVLCDRRTMDEVLWTFAGNVLDESRTFVRLFSITMVRE
jgi:hypothetical protein